VKKLRRSQFAAARNYIKMAARPLERAIFEYIFEDGQGDSVVSQLASFQNLDGGFGNALEPDMRSPSSSALAAEIGLELLAALEVPSDHGMVRKVVRYVMDNLDPHTKTWRVVPPDVNEHPHAPWWHDEDGSLAQTFDDFLVIPRAGIIAHLYHYSEIVPSSWLGELAQATVAAVRKMEDERFGGGGDALNYLRKLAETPQLPDSLKAWLVPRVQVLADRVVARNPEQWTSYSAPPVKLSPTPDAITAGVLAD
jgi:hypothetical protein